jgi:hypothetical protein
VIHAASEQDWQEAAGALRDAVRLGPEPPPTAPLVHDRIGTEQAPGDDEFL